jgi:TolB-like protein
LGDVILEGDDRHGDGVNLAARLEGIADPGGIILSGTAYDQLKKKVDVGFEYLGEQQIKNIAEPVRVYRLLMDPAAAGKTVSAGFSINSSKSKAAAASWLTGGRAWLRLASAAGLLLLIAMGSVMAWRLSRDAPVAQSQGIPVIAVMPFQDLTGDQTASALGRGIAEAFMTDLATFPDYQVASAATSFALADEPVSKIVEATGATFVIEGSIRRTADQLKVTMQLIRGSTDRHLMSAEVVEPMTDSVGVQSAVANRLRDALGGLTGVLRRESNRMALEKSPEDLTEYDYYTLGHMKQFRQEGSAARDIWTEGLKRYPDSVLLHCKLAFYYLAFTSDFDSAEKLVNEARTLKKKSRLDAWYLHWSSAWIHSMFGETEKAIADVKATIAIAPYDTVSHMDMADIMISAGHKEEALSWATYAATHDPNPVYWFPGVMIKVYRGAGKWPELVELAEREIEKRPNKFWYEVLTAAYTATGQADKAAAAFKVGRSMPDTRLQED